MSFLERHALDNVWCAPDQDSQYVFKPQRLSNDFGVRKSAKVLWSNVTLPTQNDLFDVFQIGKISKHTLDIVPSNLRWVRLDKLLGERGTFIEITNEDGKVIPRYNAYLMKTASKNILIAVVRNERVANPVKKPFYIKFYSNTYFKSCDYRQTFDTILSQGKTIVEDLERFRMVDTFNTLNQKYGKGLRVYHNGFLVNSPIPQHMRVGDTVEFLVDTSIRQVTDHKVSDMNTFVSTLDSLQKYLIFREVNQTRVDFEDDIDIVVLQKINNIEKGLSLIKFKPSDFRMVTHKDYSIPTQRLGNLVNFNEFLTSVSELTIRLYSRQTGLKRELIDEATYLKEWVKLPFNKQKDALLGLNSSLDMWKADNLESGLYNSLMRRKIHQITRDDVTDTYGYYAISKLVANTPQRVVNDGGSNVVTLPVGLRERSTCFEYDRKGRLLNYYLHTDSPKYFTVGHTAEIVESIPGFGTTKDLIQYDKSVMTLRDRGGYKAFKAIKVEGKPLQATWTVAIEGDDYIIVDKELRWLINTNDNFVALVDQYNFLLTKFDISNISGTISFNLSMETEVEGGVETVPLYIPPAKLDVFLNGACLINNLDYFVDWPRVVIANKSYLNEQYVQNVTVRGYGICSDTLEFVEPSEIGFVRNGRLSLDNQFDLRDDRVSRLVVDGRLHLKNEVNFEEGVCCARVTDIREGAPYVVEDMLIPTTKFTGRPTYEHHGEAKVIADKVSGYLTEHFPFEERTPPNTITHRHLLCSPFLSRVHRLISSGHLYPDGIKGIYTDRELEEWLEDYIDLLDFDPLLKGVDTRYVEIHPHQFYTVTELDIYQYNFFNRIVKFYYGDKVNISSHIRIKEGMI